MAKSRRNWRDVLVYSDKPAGQSTLRAYYRKYRVEAGMPFRCDIPTCALHTGPLDWNNIALNLILDHVDGARRNNRPKNLRFLCPNCSSQQPTHGGGNKGRVKYTSGGYETKQKDGKRAYQMIVGTGSYGVTGMDVTLTHGQPAPSPRAESSRDRM